MGRAAEDGRGASGRVLRHAGLRRILFAEAAVVGAQTAVEVAFTVLAFAAGGASLLGATTGAMFIGVGLARPVVGLWLDRVSPRNELRSGVGLVMVGAAVGLAGAALAGVVGAIVALIGLLAVQLGHSICKTARRAAVAIAADDPEQAVATVGMVSLANSITQIAGPALVAVAVALAGATGGFATGVVLYALGSLLMLRLPLSSTPASADASLGVVASGQRETIGVKVVGLSFVVLTASAVVVGGLSVLYAPLAIDALDIGDAGIGILKAAHGVGGLFAALVLLRLGPSSRNGLRLGLSGLAVALPVALLAPVSIVPVALVLMAIIGAAKPWRETGLQTLIQRSLADTLHSRVFGLAETAVFLGGTLGAVAVPVLLSLAPLSVALIAVGLAALIPALLVTPGLRRLDADAPAPREQVELLRRTELFSFLPPIEMDLLAARLVPREVEEGEVVMTQGEEGSSYFVIERGEMEVLVDGEPVATMTAPEGFGEIALLRTSMRTATVRATEPARIHELSRKTFMRALGITDAAAIEAVADSRLSRAAPSDLSR